MEREVMFSLVLNEHGIESNYNFFFIRVNCRADDSAAVVYANGTAGLITMGYVTQHTHS